MVEYIDVSQIMSSIRIFVDDNFDDRAFFATLR